MGWASGVYTRIFGSTGWQNDKAALIKILASRHDSHDQDIGDGLNTLRTELRGEALTNSTKVLTSVAGTNTITASMTSATPAGTLTAYSAGLSVVLTPANTNSGATTLNINSLGALDVMNSDGTACVGGELIAGVTTELTLDAGADDWIITSPPFSWAISPTWSNLHRFTRTATDINGSVLISAALPMITIRETDAAANNGYWQWFAQGEQMGLIAVNDANSASGTIMTVDRTGTTVDKVNFPTGTGNTPFRVGTDRTVASAMASFETDTASVSAALFTSDTAGVHTVAISNTATAGDNLFLSFYTEGSGVPLTTFRGSIDFNRAATQVRYNVTCDRTLKTAIGDAGSAIAALMAIPVRSYRWKETGNLISFGFIAQEVNPVLPEAVSPGVEGRPWGMDYSKMVPVLCKALQETIQRCETLETRVSALEGVRIGALPK